MIYSSTENNLCWCLFMEDDKMQPTDLPQNQPVDNNLLPNVISKEKPQRTKRYLLIIIVGALTVLAVAAFYRGLLKNGGRVNVSASDVTLTPSIQDSLGVDPKSIFILASKFPLRLSDIKSSFQVKPALAFEVAEVKNSEYRISFDKPLTEGKVYTFSLATTGASGGQASESASVNKDLSWAFQIKNPFRVIQALPKNKATSVPLNSGIEITFSHDGYKSIEGFFEITPAVTGQFEKHKRSAVFVPKSLLPGTLYTVKVRKGLGLEGSNELLKDDYVFQFETQADTGSNYRVGFNRELSEFPSTDAPAFSLYLIDNNFAPDLAVDVYGFKNISEFLASLTEKDKIPVWANYSRSSHLQDVSGLTKLLSFNAPVQKFQYSGYFVFPQTLSDGYYLVDVKYGGSREQTYLQITDVATYLSTSNTKAVAWVNDVGTKKPLSRAQVSLVGGNLSQITDQEGVAYFDTPVELKNSETRRYFTVTAPSGKTSVVPVDQTYDHYNYYGGYYDRPSSTADEYWSYIYLDRSIYLPADTVNFWGIIRNRNNPKETKPLKITLSGYGYYSEGYSPSSISEKEIQPTDSGTFLGQIALPNLKAGSYSVEVKMGEETLVSTSFSVQTYTKPAYKIDLEPARKAIFAGDTVNFKGKVNFFEGTPVDKVSLKYTVDQLSGQSVSNGSGQFDVSYKPEYKEAAGDYYTPYPTSAYMGVTPTLPEEGEIEGGTSVLVFGPQISLKADSLVSQGLGRVKLTVNNIDIERINNGTAKDNNDYLGGPSVGQQISGKLYEYHWEKKEIGQNYDFINKVTSKTYDYTSVKNFLADVSVVTDSNGQANYEFSVADEKYYELDLTSADALGRNAKVSAYLYGEHGRAAGNSRYYFLESNKKDTNEYSVSDPVTLTFKEGGEASPSAQSGSYIFRLAQRGIMGYKVQESPVYSFNFGESDVPNVVAEAVYFNGKTFYESESLLLSFKETDKKLTIDVKADKASYKPRDSVAVEVMAKDKDGVGQKAEVNLSLVDESVFKLQGQDVDTLGNLYKSVPSGIIQTYVSHQYPTEVSSAEGGGCFLAGTKILLPGGREKNIEDVKAGDVIVTRESESSGRLVEARVGRTLKHIVGQYLVINNTLRVTPEHNLYVNGRWMVAEDVKLGDSLLTDLDSWVRVYSIESHTGSFQVYNFVVNNYKTYFANRFYVHNMKGRDLFMDNAFFGVVKTDGSGYGKVSFSLPDNLTSWRVTYQGISDTLGAGNGTTLIPVKLPFFVDAVFNSEYLEEDRPVIKIRAFGEGLKSGQDVTFTVTAPTLGLTEGKKLSAKAFESVSFALPNLLEGEHKITVSGKSGALEDSLTRSIKVYKTRLSKAQSDFQTLTTTTSISGSKNLPTTLIFSDGNRGRFYPTLVGLYYTYGDRVDQKVTRIKAGELLSAYFSQKPSSLEEFKASNYQGTDGGIALFPYSASDLVLSAKISATAADLFDRKSLRQYFYKVLDDPAEGIERTAISLFGLAGLDEPVLVPVKSLMARSDLTPVEELYLGLATAKLGDKEGGRSVLASVLSQYGEELKPMLRVKVGSDQDAILEATSLASDLAALVGESTAEGLLSYVLKNYTKDITVDLEQLFYVSNMLPLASPQPVQFTYVTASQKVTKTLKNGETFKAQVSPAELSGIKFENISGNVGLTSLYFEPFDSGSVKKDSNLSISRSYSVSGNPAQEFGESDLVQVRLTPKFGAQVIDGCYQVSDLLPSGLKVITKLYSRGLSDQENVWYPYDVTGQQVNFCVNKSIDKPILYYARVISTGDYKAESALVQALNSTDSFNISPPTSIKIK